MAAASQTVTNDRPNPQMELSSKLSRIQRSINDLMQERVNVSFTVPQDMGTEERLQTIATELRQLNVEKTATLAALAALGIQVTLT